MQFLNDSLNKLPKWIKAPWETLTLQQKAEDYINFMQIQANAEVETIAKIIKNPKVTEAATRVIRYFQEHDIYIKSILQARETILQADICIGLLHKHSEVLDRILNDKQELKKAVVIIKFLEEDMHKGKMHNESLILILTDPQMLSTMYLNISNDISKKNETGKVIEMSQIN